MKVGDLISFWSYGEKHTGIVIDDDERNHTGVRFFVAFSPDWHPDGLPYGYPFYRGYYDRIDKPAGPQPPGEKFVEVISEIR